MGRQSARLWHDGKDHKDFWKLIEAEESFLNKAWRMHWRIQKNGEVLWEKLPPDFLISGRENRWSYLFESVTGKTFTNLGYLKSYINSTVEFGKFCKVKKRIFSIGSEYILYSDNCYTWKLLNVGDILTENREYIVTIENYDNNLLICTDRKVITYDYVTNVFDVIYNKSGMHIQAGSGQFDGVAACIGDTACVRAYDKDKKRLLVFKNKVLSKEIEVSRIYWIEKSTDAFFLSASINSNVHGLLKSRDGVIWDAVSDNMPHYILHHNGITYGLDRDTDSILRVRKLNGNNYTYVENNVKACIFSSFGGFIVTAKEYIYMIDKDYNVIRFKNFDDDSVEILIDKKYSIGQGTYGIYMGNLEE